MEKPNASEGHAKQLENEYKIMGLFIDNAKTYTQLSSIALALSITFLRDLLGIEKDKPMPLDWFVKASWISLLIAVGAGVYYQYFAVKYLENLSDLINPRHRSWPKALVDHPWPIYLIMMIAFYAGAVLLTISAFRRM
jgi:hypothetical protein